MLKWKLTTPLHKEPMGKAGRGGRRRPIHFPGLLGILLKECLAEEFPGSDHLQSCIFQAPRWGSWVSVLLQVCKEPCQNAVSGKAVPLNPKASVTAAVPLGKQKNKSCPKHMQCDGCLLLPHMAYNHLKEMCEKCLS